LPRIIGVDESGKGDFFGPLVVAALLASDDAISALTSLGVRDSKLISDGKMLEIDAELRAAYPHAFFVLMPSEYNRRYAEIRNLNVLLAQGHAEVITALLAEHEADKAISDKFGKPEHIERALRDRRCPVALEQIVRGESIAQVAGASILARARFVREMTALSEQWGMKLQKGASSLVDRDGQEFVRRHGVAALKEVAKTHFKNYQRALKPSLF
jgi:ribonuclease HIII